MNNEATKKKNKKWKWSTNIEPLNLHRVNDIKLSGDTSTYGVYLDDESVNKRRNNNSSSSNRSSIKRDTRRNTRNR
ncbi:MAG: hypothetical protein IKA36_00840 [Clostridia bacterium]|nr:hypothetical protein [Clostridia bacterium]